MLIQIISLQYVMQNMQIYFFFKTVFPTPRGLKKLAWYTSDQSKRKVHTQKIKHKSVILHLRTFYTITKSRGTKTNMLSIPSASNLDSDLQNKNSKANKMASNAEQKPTTTP